jgi:hypothetical protein
LSSTCPAVPSQILHLAGSFGEISLDGLKFAGAVWWPGRLDEGNGHILPIVDETADEEQRNALLTILSG